MTPVREPRWAYLLKNLERRAAPLLALVLIALIFFLGIRSERTGFVDDVLDPSLKRITHPVLNAFRGRPPAIAQLDVILSDPGSDSLFAIQDQALLNGWLDAQDNVWIPAMLERDESDLRMFIQLQEGPVDRNAIPRWPFAIAVGQADAIIHPRIQDLFPISDAMPIHGALLRSAFRKAGIPIMEQDLVELRLAEKKLGLYLLEGRGDSAQLAAWSKGAGPLLRFDDVLHKHALRHIDDMAYEVDVPLGAEWLSAPIVASQKYLGATSLTYTAEQRNAFEDLERFRAGTRSASEVFDATALGSFLALCDLLGAQETAHWWNLRFLHDSASQRFIIIPQRTLAGVPIKGILARHTEAPLAFPSTSSTLVGRFLSDPVVYAAYIAELYAHSSPAWLEELLKEDATELSEISRMVRSEYPDAALDLSILDHCQKVVKMMLYPAEPALAYLRYTQQRKYTIAVANVHDLPLVIRGHIADRDTIPLGIPIVIPPRERGRPLVYSTVQIAMPKDSTATLSLLVSLYGSDQRMAVTMRSSATFVGNTQTQLP